MGWVLADRPQQARQLLAHRVVVDFDSHAEVCRLGRCGQRDVDETKDLAGPEEGGLLDLVDELLAPSGRGSLEGSGQLPPDLVEQRHAVAGRSPVELAEVGEKHGLGVLGVALP